ncbi:hypothetical protein H1R20_g11164, partial [Candolleomyces eurysporus]
MPAPASSLPTASGTQVKVVATIPNGSGSSRSQYRIDGGSPVTVERACGSDPQYGVTVFENAQLRDGEHTLVITNIGNTADYRLDKIEWVASNGYPEEPLPPLPPTPPTPPTTSVPSNNDSPSQPVSQPQVPSTREQTQHPTTTIITRISDSGVTSVVTSVVTPTVTSISSGNTGTTGSATDSSSGAALTGGTSIPLQNGGETLIVKEVVSSTVTTRDPSNTNSPGGLDNTGATGKFHLSTGALAGIIVGSLILLFILLILLFVLFRRWKQRRDLLNKPMNDGAWAPGEHTREIRRGNTNLTPFDIAAQRTSAFLAGGALRNNDRNMGAFTRLQDDARAGPSALLPVHKSALNNPGSPHSPGGLSSTNSAGSPSDNSRYSSTLLPTDAGNLFQHATLHRRRNTSEIGEPDGEQNAVPPPSYQASTLLQNASSVESGDFFSAEGGSSASGSSKH